MRALLIVNPNATSTTPAARDLLAHALSSRVRVTVAHTTHRNHAAELAAQAREDGMGLIIVHGGDGTVNEVVNGLLGVPVPRSMSSVTVGAIPPVAVVPGGSANVFARSLGIEADPVAATNQLIELLARRARRTIGLGHCDGRWFLFNAGMGFDADVCRAIEASRKNGGPVSAARYVSTAVRTFFRTNRLEPKLTVTMPDSTDVAGVYYAFVSNSSPWTYLDQRAVHTNPNTTFDGGLGLFAMQTTKVLPTLRVARQMLVAGATPKSKHLVRLDDVSKVSISARSPIALQLDGDFVGMRENVDFCSTPSALEVIAPEAQ